MAESTQPKHYKPEKEAYITDDEHGVHSSNSGLSVAYLSVIICTVFDLQCVSSSSLLRHAGDWAILNVRSHVAVYRLRVCSQ